MTDDFLSSVVSKMEETKAGFSRIDSSLDDSDSLVKLDPNTVGNWEFRDRQSFELGDIAELSNSIRNKGQAQPIVVVHSNELFKSDDDKHYPYIVIAGYRRWLACKSEGLMIDAIIRKLSFEQAISCLVSENEKVSVSDFSKGMFYKNLLDREKITKKELYERLGLKRTNFDHFLAFSEVSDEVWNSIGDMKSVSARTAYAIKALCQKGDEYKRAIIKISDQIRGGAGEKKINSMVSRLLRENNVVKDNATRVALSEQVSLEANKNDLKLKVKNLPEKKYELLKSEIIKMVEKLIKQSKI